jgi:hypothetical protein
MNTEIERVNTPGKPKLKPTTDYIRIRRETKKKILSELATINKKEHGKSVTPEQYIALAISLLSSSHVEQLKEQSLSNKDRLETEFKKYCSEHGKVTMDEFIGILLTVPKLK